MNESFVSEEKWHLLTRRRRASTCWSKDNSKKEVLIGKERRLTIPSSLQLNLELSSSRPIVWFLLTFLFRVSEMRSNQGSLNRPESVSHYFHSIHTRNSRLRLCMTRKKKGGDSFLRGHFDERKRFFRTLWSATRSIDLHSLSSFRNQLRNQFTDDRMFFDELLLVVSNESLCFGMKRFFVGWQTMSLWSDDSVRTFQGMFLHAVQSMTHDRDHSCSMSFLDVSASHE